jgi:hypothetical protein
MPNADQLCFVPSPRVGLVMVPAHCPSCGKEFRDHTSVVRHLSQPQSGCNNWLDNLIQLNSTLAPTEHNSMAVDNVNAQAPYNYQQGEDASYYDLGN